MKKMWLPLTTGILACMVFTLLVGQVSAQMNEIAQMNIKAIKKMNFVDGGKNINLTNTIVFANAATTEIKLRNPEFKISLKSDVGSILIGTGTVPEILFPAATAEQPEAEVTQEITVTVGPKDEDTIMRLITLFNALGDPEAEFTLLLEGTTEVGVKNDKGWVYQKGISVEFEFEPSIQREVLFN